MLTWMRALLGCTVIGAIALLYVEFGHSQYALESTAVGQLQHLALTDGSRIDLNTDSSIRTRVGGDTRTARLTRGEARFRTQRPFEVLVGAASVHSTGADFCIRIMNESQINLLVSSGRVDISVPSARSLLTASAGDSISLRVNSTYVRKRLSAAALERRTAWTDGWLWFSAEPLEQAFAEFNRYQHRHLVLVDPSLADLKIGGRFRSSDLDSFIASLQHSFEVRTATVSLPGARADTIYVTQRCPRALQQCN